MLKIPLSGYPYGVGILKANLIFEPIGDELLIYDQQQDEVHSLSAFEARVTTLLRDDVALDEIATQLRVERLAVDGVVDELKLIGLIASEPIDLQVNKPGTDDRLNRRNVLAKGLVATAAAGAILSIKAPEAQAALSCQVNTGGTCTASTSGNSCCRSGCCCRTLLGTRVCRTTSNCNLLLGSCI